MSEPFGRLRRVVFNALCLTSFGHAGLEPVWASIRLEEEGDDIAWAEGIRQTVERLNNMLIVVRTRFAASTHALTVVSSGELAAGNIGRVHHHGSASSVHHQLWAARALHMYARCVRATDWGHHRCVRLCPRDR